MGAQFHERTFEQQSRLSSLANDWQRELAALWRLEADVNNGGYLQFLGNWGRESYTYASQGLKNIGAGKMADLVDRCQALVDEHVNCQGKSLHDLERALPEAIAARVLAWSYEFMAYPDDVASLGMQYYRAHLDGATTD
jgi:hypothetical protein